MWNNFEKSPTLFSVNSSFFEDISVLITTLILQSYPKGYILSYFYKLPRALSLSRMLVAFSLKLLYPTLCGKCFEFMEFTFLKDALIQAIFTHAPPHLKLAPKVSHPSQKKLLILPGSILSKMCFPHSRKGWIKLWFALSKFSQKIWRWLETLDFLYFVWLSIFGNVMVLQIILMWRGFCK